MILTSQLYKVLNKILESTDILDEKKTVGFIENAADVYENKSFVLKDREAFIENDFSLIDIDLRETQYEALEKILNQVDIIFVSGGNTFYLLEQIQKAGFHKILSRFLTQGKIYIGSSAGSVVLGKTIEHVQDMDDPTLSNLTEYSGLNILDTMILPHYGNKKYLEASNTAIKLYGKEKFITISDDEFHSQVYSTQ